MAVRAGIIVPCCIFSLKLIPLSGDILPHRPVSRHSRVGGSQLRVGRSGNLGNTQSTMCKPEFGMSTCAAVHASVVDPLHMYSCGGLSLATSACTVVLQSGRRGIRTESNGCKLLTLSLRLLPSSSAASNHCSVLQETICVCEAQMIDVRFQSLRA